VTGDAEPPSDPPGRAEVAAGVDVVGTQQRARARFAASAQAYVSSVPHARGDELPRLIQAARSRLGELTGLRALDVASGGGHTARALAEAGARVTVSDLTPEMLAAAEAQLRGALPDAALHFVAAAAEALPFEDGAFEIVSCRIAAHHFGDPRVFLSEVRRVLVPGGVFLLVDNVAPEDARLGEAMNHVERLRDPSHVEAYRVSTWVGWLGEVGLEPYLLERFWRVKPLASWLRRADTSPENEAALRSFVDGADEAVRRYLIAPDAAATVTAAAVRDGPFAEGAASEVRLRHEVVLLAATAGPS
jgi:ubiquinone/menaquinone biosynthesis C-methylase UbiE